ncbi:undecaprenyl-diphosphatase [Saccharomonospora amisosensis]|uniref:Undecaprenyl-diphosphatase n=1 Tax=Saccharomonospora amisosensis TaxID=1128677 RepID=A0A7X5USN3_9PSEU|nr:undecaprenyl-diphosphatase [Saccharomonospora amisosensis]
MTTARSNVVLGAVLLAVFVALGLVVRGSPGVVDDALRETIGGQWQGAVGTVAAWVSLVLGPPLPVITGVALIVVTVRLRQLDDPRTRTLLRVLILLVACRITSVVAKPIFARDRPRTYPDAFSYPSGHVASVASTGFALAVLCAWLYPHLVRLVSWLAVVATALAAAARVALAVHWLTDTVGAVLAVGGVGLLVGVALKLLPPPRGGVASAS